MGIVEEHETNTVSPNPLGSYLNAKERSSEAFEKHMKLFDSEAHLDRVAAVCDILEGFFGCPPSYLTYRGLGSRRPFENIKVEQCGHVLRRERTAVKEDKLYNPLKALGNIEVVSKNGHFSVRVY
jgi:hypothetical protein